MKRQFFAAVLISQIFLSTIAAYAQPTKLEGTSIWFTMPNAKWKLTVSNKMEEVQRMLINERPLREMPQSLLSVL